MSFDAAILRELAVGIDVTGYLRILEARHHATPAGMGHGKTRFSSPADSFTLLYAAQDLSTALAEKVIRDRFQGRTKRVLLEADVAELVAASMVAFSPLKLLDLRASGASRLGVPTDAVRGRAQLAGRKLSGRFMTKRTSTASSICRGSPMASASRSMIVRSRPSSIQAARSSTWSGLASSYRRCDRSTSS